MASFEQEWDGYREPEWIPERRSWLKLTEYIRKAHGRFLQERNFLLRTLHCEVEAVNRDGEEGIVHRLVIDHVLQTRILLYTKFSSCEEDHPPIEAVEEQILETIQSFRDVGNTLREREESRAQYRLKDEGIREREDEWERRAVRHPKSPPLSALDALRCGGESMNEMGVVLLPSFASKEELHQWMLEIVQERHGDVESIGTYEEMMQRSIPGVIEPYDFNRPGHWTEGARQLRKKARRMVKIHGLVAVQCTPDDPREIIFIPLDVKAQKKHSNVFQVEAMLWDSGQGESKPENVILEELHEDWKPPEGVYSSTSVSIIFERKGWKICLLSSSDLVIVRNVIDRLLKEGATKVIVTVEVLRDDDEEECCDLAVYPIFARGGSEKA